MPTETLPKEAHPTASASSRTVLPSAPALEAPARATVGRPGTFLAFGILIAAVSPVLFQHVLPPDAVVPAIAIMFLLMACLAVRFARRDAGGWRRLTYWDVACFLALGGIVALASIEPEHLSRLAPRRIE